MKNLNATRKRRLGLKPKSDNLVVFFSFWAPKSGKNCYFAIRYSIHGPRVFLRDFKKFISLCRLSLKLSSTPVAQGVKSPTSRQQSTIGAKSPVSRQQSAISHAPKSKSRRSTTPDRQTSVVSKHQQKHKPRKSIAVGLKADDTLETIAPGSLVVQRYSWRSVEMGNPVMRMATTGMKGAVLDLEPG